MMLDTNALSAFVDGDAAIGALVREASSLALPTVVLGEFRFGVSGSRHRRAYEAWLHAHLPSFDVLAIDEATTVYYARVRAGLKRIGRPIPANDAWIAALALQHDLTVVSRDAHFDAVAGVRRAAF